MEQLVLGIINDYVRSQTLFVANTNNVEKLENSSATESNFKITDSKMVDVFIISYMTKQFEKIYSIERYICFENVKVSEDVFSISSLDNAIEEKLNCFNHFIEYLKTEYSSV